jgi:hypothetical protein
VPGEGIWAAWCWFMTFRLASLGVTLCVEPDCGLSPP